MALGKRELAFQRENLGRTEARDAGIIPESRFPGGRRDADARRPTVHVVGEVGGFRMARERADSAISRLRKQPMVRQSRILQQRGKCARAAAEAQCVDGQHGDPRIHVVAPVARGLEPARERLPQDHPQRIAGGDAVPCGQHELVAVGMFRTAVIVAQPAQIRPRQVHRDVIRRISQRPAKVPRLGIVAEHGQGHAGHVPDIFQILQILRRQQFRR